MRGKQWSEDEEKQLRLLAEISRVMGKTRVSVRSKMYHLGLSVVDAAAPSPSIAVSVASIASVASTPKPIIDQPPIGQAPSQVPIIDHQSAADSASLPSEVSRLHNIIVGVKVYQEFFAKFVDYCGLETEVLELRRQLASKIAESSCDKSS